MIDRFMERIVMLAQELLVRAATAGHAIDSWRMARNTERLLRKMSLYPVEQSTFGPPSPMVYRLLGYSILIDDVVPFDQIWLYDRDGRKIGALSVIE